jgi:hypothetical protein
MRPQFIYCSISDTNLLYRTHLLTGEQSYRPILGYVFLAGSCWRELPGASLLITGGSPGVRDVAKIDTLREWAASSEPPMHTARYDHAAVYHSQHLYVLGGYTNYRCLGECERYVCAESRWEVLPALPIACCAMSAVLLDNSLYVLGGYDGRDLNTVQKLHFDSLTWKLMGLKLPPARHFPCFKTETQVYLVVKKKVYCFSPRTVKLVKTLTQVACNCYSSYYSCGFLYITKTDSIESLAIGELK